MAKKKALRKKAATKHKRGAKPARADKSSKLTGLRAKFLGTKKAKRPAKKTSARKSKARSSDSDNAARDADAESVVRRAMPGVKIVHPKRPSGSADSQTTVHGASLPALRRKYAGDTASPLADAEAVAAPPVDSKVVYVEYESDNSDSEMGPKAVIVRDGRVSGYQG